MRKLASIEKIESVSDIPDSDRLSVATMVGKGWQVVVGRNEFKPGDTVCYLEIDSFLPADDSRFDFLRDKCLRVLKAVDGTELDRGLRIKTVKLRGVLSQGLVFGLDKFPELAGCSLGDDVTDRLHVRHFDEVCELYADKMVRNKLSADAYCKFPIEIPKTDATRIQCETNRFERDRGRLFEVSVKADGTSITMAYVPSVHSDRPFIVCTHNNDIKPECSDERKSVPMPWKFAYSLEVERKLKEHYDLTGKELALQGELVGIGIQKNRNKLKDNDWLIFRIWNVTDQKFMEPAERREFCKKNGFHHVEIVSESMDVFNMFHTTEEILKFAEGKTAAGNEREGLVFKSCDGGPYTCFKAVSNKYMLKED